MTVLDVGWNDGVGLVVGGHHFVFDVEDAFGDDHFEFVDFAVAGVFVVFLVVAVEDLGAVEVDFKAALVGRGEFDGNVAGVLGTPEFGRQPRGEAVVASRDAIDDVHGDFAELGTGHSHAGCSCYAVVEEGYAVWRHITEWPGLGVVGFTLRRNAGV